MADGLNCVEYFCSQYLSEDKCGRGDACIFIHAKLEDVLLVHNCPSAQCDFVTGRFCTKNSPLVLDQTRGKSKWLYSFGGKAMEAAKNSRHAQRRNSRSSDSGKRRGRKNKYIYNQVQAPPSPLEVSEASSSYDPSDREVNQSVDVMPGPSTNSTTNLNAVTSGTESEEEQDSGAWATVSRKSSKHQKSLQRNLLDIHDNRRRNGESTHNLQTFNQIRTESSSVLAQSASVSPRDQLAQESLVGSTQLKTTTSSADNSSQKTCGICFEVVLEKVSGNRRFGILPNCNHCFCLTCICKWREAKQFENKIIRACPECRVVSDYVCPSPFWVDTPEEKSQTITNYKNTCAKRNCKHYKRGKGKCPFGNKCFYLHALPDGTKVDVGPPRRRRRSRNDSNAEMEMDLIRFIVSMGEDLLLDSDSDSSDISVYYDSEYDSEYEYAFYNYLNDGEDDSNYFNN